ncbi:hypothetical protein [Taibaiella koreensis]|uniref:hypothetical protein n=1 Tax=Taibaiella koreensis TaxID=1268548 RepID=UPI000E59D815|nr:hypothetical protein [Taibaiella koreensis]
MRFFTEKDKIIKSFAIGDQEIMAADTFFPVETALREYIDSGKKKLLDTALRFRYEDIGHILLFDNDNCVRLLVKKNGKSQKIPLEFSSRDDYNWLLQLLETKTGLQPTSSKPGAGNGWARIRNYLITLAVALFSAALAGIAYEQEQGKQVPISGGRRGIKMLMSEMAGWLGFYGSLALGLAVTLAVLFYTIRKNKRLVATQANRS